MVNRADIRQKEGVYTAPSFYLVYDSDSGVSICDNQSDVRSKPTTKSSKLKSKVALGLVKSLYILTEVVSCWIQPRWGIDIPGRAGWIDQDR